VLVAKNLFFGLEAVRFLIILGTLRFIRIQNVYPILEGISTIMVALEVILKIEIFY
jgi:hypothetical protein